MSVIVLVYPETRKARISIEERQAIVMRLFADKLQEFVMAFFRKYEQATVLYHPFVNGANAMPSPGLDSLAHSIVEHDRDVCLVDLQLGTAFRFQLFLREIRGNEGKIFAWNSVSFRRVAVTAVGKRRLPHAARNHDD